MLALQGQVFSMAKGWMGVATSANGIAIVTRPMVAEAEARRELARLSPQVDLVDGAGSPLARAFAGKLQRYFAGERVLFDEPVDLNGVSSFGRAVLEAVREIQYG